MCYFNIILTWFLIHSIGYIGIALAYVIHKTIKTMILLALLKRKVRFNYNEILKFISKIIFAGIIFTTITLLLRAFAYNDIYKLKIRIAIISATFITGIVTYLITLYFSKELRVKYKSDNVKFV